MDVALRALGDSGLSMGEIGLYIVGSAIVLAAVAQTLTWAHTQARAVRLVRVRRFPRTAPQAPPAALTATIAGPPVEPVVRQSAPERPVPRTPRISVDDLHPARVRRPIVRQPTRMPEVSGGRHRLRGAGPSQP